MAQWLRALTALPEDLGSTPSIHMAAHNCLQLELLSSTIFTQIHMKANTNVHKIKINRAGEIAQ